MLTQKGIARLAQLAKLKPEELTAAITAATEVEITVDETIQVFTADEIASRDSQQQQIGHRTGVAEGKTAGKEIGTKLIKQKFGIEGDEKDIDKVVDAAYGMVGKDNAMKEQVTLLQQNLSAKEVEIATMKQKMESAETNMRRISNLHPNKSADFTTDEHLFFVNNKLKFTESGIEHEGKVLRHDKTQEPLSEKEAIHWLYENKLPHLLSKAAGGAAGGGGRGGSSSSTLNTFKPKNAEEWQEHWIKNNPDKPVTGLEAQAQYKADAKENPDLLN